ncbi:MAG: hypothetical protein JWN94_2105 [Betaproteobacteria bacterium]|nr:hypothetical protein [Betaproteobacteria bacterium]
MPMQNQYSRRAILLLLAFGAPAVSGADAPPKTFELNLAQGAVPAAQRVLKVEKGDAVALKLTSDAAGELHLHGYRLAISIVPGQIAQLSFTAHATGRYPFEWHRSDSPAAGGSQHRGPPLAALEVRPK